MPDFPLAIFSDVHSNLEALQAVLADMEALGVSPSFCLGDTVGYGPNPGECLEMVRALGCPVIRGNHDAAVAGDSSLEGVSDTARSGMEFARRELSTTQRAYLASLPLFISKLGCDFVHASMDEPGEWWYVLSELDAVAHFDAQQNPICFCGHTHVPQVWHVDDDWTLTTWRGEGKIHLPAKGKTLINVGSVGQPRDRCPDACYVICHPKEHWVEFRRVPYDIAATGKKILRAKLPRLAAERLRDGR